MCIVSFENDVFSQKAHHIAGGILDKFNTEKMKYKDMNLKSKFVTCILKQYLYSIIRKISNYEI